MLDDISDQHRQQQQEMERGYLFTLELRVCRQVAKLNVYEEDSLNDLINRLSSTVTYKQKYAQRLKEKLEAEFRKLVSTQDCSHKVREKLLSLTQESKLIIVGISEPEKNELADETPFKILLENSANFRKRSVEQPPRYASYEHESPKLTRNYDKDPVVNYEERVNQVKNRSYLADNMRNKEYQPYNPMHNTYDNCNPSNNYLLHEERKNLQDYSPIAGINSKRSMPNNENYEPRMYYGAAEVMQRRKEGQIRKHNMAVNYEESRKDSFQDYKVHKIKSLSALGANQMNQIRPRYDTNVQDNFMSMGQNKVVYNRNQEDLKIDYSSKCIDSKTPFVPRERGGKKFSYLSQQKF